MAMSRFGHTPVFVLGLTVALTLPAFAQAPKPAASHSRTAAAPVVSDPTNIDAGKSGEQLFKSNCAICHKSAAGLAKAGGLFGVAGFLREHYTASKESAAIIAGYLQAVDAATPPGRAARRPSDGKRTSKRSDETKRGSAKPTEAKPDEIKPAAAKVEDTPRPPVSVPTESKPAEPAPAAEAKPAAPAEQKPADAPKSE